MKIPSLSWRPVHDEARQGYTRPHTLSTLLDKTSRVWTRRQAAAPSSPPRPPIGAYHDHDRDHHASPVDITARSPQADDGSQGGPRPDAGSGAAAADEPSPTTGSPVSGTLTGDLLVASATSGHTSDATATPSSSSDHGSRTPAALELTLTTLTTLATASSSSSSSSSSSYSFANPSNATWIDPQPTVTTTTTITTAPNPSSPAPADASEAAPSRFGPMSLDGDEVVALIAGGIILLLLLLVLVIWFALRDPYRNASVTAADAESGRGLADSPPVISLTLLEPSAMPRALQKQDVLGRAAETGPGSPNWPLPQNQVRIPLRPRPKRRTLSSELSPFGYIRRSDMSDLASGPGSGPGTRPASISAAWLSPSHAAMARGSPFGGSNNGGNSGGNSGGNTRGNTGSNAGSNGGGNGGNGAGNGSPSTVPPGSPPV